MIEKAVGIALVVVGFFLNLYVKMREREKHSVEKRKKIKYVVKYGFRNWNGIRQLNVEISNNGDSPILIESIVLSFLNSNETDYIPDFKNDFDQSFQRLDPKGHARFHSRISDKNEEAMFLQTITSERVRACITITLSDGHEFIVNGDDIIRALKSPSKRG